MSSTMWDLHKEAKDLHRDAVKRSTGRGAPENKSECALTMIAMAATAMCGLYAAEVHHARKPRR
uniref:hypothetical protein n=1 Tax=Amycolatopsis sp. CA-096443 TaxID=3239919 RepID=UPI003F4969B3